MQVDRKKPKKCNLWSKRSLNRNRNFWKHPDGKKIRKTTQFQEKNLNFLEREGERWSERKKKSKKGKSGIKQNMKIPKERKRERAPRSM